MKFQSSEIENIEDKFKEIEKEFKKYNILYPTETQIKKYFKPDEKKWVLFAYYLLHTNPKPQTLEERQSRFFLKEFVHKNMEVVPDEPSKEEKQNTRKEKNNKENE